MMQGVYILSSGDTLSHERALALHISARDLVSDTQGQFYRNWRKHIQTADDIWEEIARLTQIPGVTSAPKLQPIETRLIMLQNRHSRKYGNQSSGCGFEQHRSFWQRIGRNSQKRSFGENTYGIF